MSESRTNRIAYKGDIYDFSSLRSTIDKILEPYDPYDRKTRFMYHLLRGWFDGTKSLVWAIRYAAVQLAGMHKFNDYDPLPILYKLLEYFPQVTTYTSPDIRWALAMQGADANFPAWKSYLRLYNYTITKSSELQQNYNKISKPSWLYLPNHNHSLVSEALRQFELTPGKRLAFNQNDVTDNQYLVWGIRFKAVALAQTGDRAAIPKLNYLLEVFSELESEIAEVIYWAIDFLSGDYNYQELQEERSRTIKERKAELEIAFTYRAVIKAVPGAGYVNDVYGHELLSKIWGWLVIRYNLFGKNAQIVDKVREHFAGRKSLVWAVRWSVVELAGLEKGLNLQVLNDFYQEYGNIEVAIAREIQWAIALVEAPTEEKERQIQQRRLELAIDFRNTAIIWGYVNEFSDWEYLKEFLTDLLKRHGLTDENDPIRQTLETKFAKTNGSVMNAISWAGIELGRMGDRRAIPILREFYEQHPEKAGRVRYKPGDIMLTLKIDNLAWALAMYGEVDMLPYMERGVRADNNDYDYGLTKEGYLEAIERIRQAGS